MYSDGKERRKYKRYENLPTEDPIMAGFQIRYEEVQEIESDDWYIVTLTNISVGGTFFYAKQDLGIGTPLGLKIDMPKSTPTINCAGKIIRCDELQPTNVFCIAIKFIDIGEQEKEMINTTIEELLE